MWGDKHRVIFIYVFEKWMSQQNFAAKKVIYLREIFCMWKGQIFFLDYCEIASAF